MAHEVRIGCSGWAYRDWREVLYPPGLPQRDWLVAYARAFDTVEVNASFYRLVPEGTAARWAAVTPPGFVFSVKGSRYLTHLRRLRDAEEGLARFDARIAPLRAAGKLKPLLWQLPPDFARDDERLAGFLAMLPPGRHALEVRHASWWAEDVFAHLRAHGVALVLADRGGPLFAAPVMTAPWSFVRLHAGAEGGDGAYGPGELRAWAARLRELAEHGPVFAYLNNDWRGHAVRDARALRELVYPPAE